MRNALPALVMALALAGPAAAQSTTPESLSPGARLRLTLTEAEQQRTVARLERLQGETLVLRVPDGASREVPLASLVELDVSRGRSRGLWTGLGLVTGAAAGILYTRSLEDDPDDVTGVGRVADGLGNTLMGMIVGGVAGYFLAPERWRSVSLPGR